MVGRIPVLDVTPQLEGGKHPAKAAVGEPFEVTAVVVREGHDALAAEVVLIDPGGRRRRAPQRMRRSADDVDRWRATVGRGPGGPVVVRGPRVERPGRELAARRRDQGARRHRHRADVRRGCARARARGVGDVEGRQEDACSTPSRRSATPTAPTPYASGRRWRPRSPPRSPPSRCATWSPWRDRSPSSPTGTARCTDRGTSSSRAPRAPTSTRPARSSAAPSRPPRSDWRASRRWGSTSSTCRRSTRSARSIARGPTTP